MPSAATMVAQRTPVLQSSDRMLDASPAAAMPAPTSVTDDPIATKSWRDELGYAAITAVRKHTAVALAHRLHHRAAVVNRIVTVARATGRCCDDMQIGTTHHELSVARPAIVLGASSGCVVARRDERPVDDPRPAPIVMR